jgi:hypothetical protein
MGHVLRGEGWSGWVAYQRTWMQNNYYNFHLNILKR